MLLIRDVQNGHFKFGSVSVLRKTAGSVRFRFQFGFELVSNARFLKFNLNFNLNHIVFVYKNVKALWEWL